MADAQLIFSGSDPIDLTGERMVIGRSLNSDIPVDETPVNGTYGVSRRHALLQNSDGVWSICDMGSSNGTKVNGVPLQPEECAELKDGDVIELGKRVKATFSQPEDYMDGEGTVIIGEETASDPYNDGTVLMDDHGGYSSSQYRYTYRKAENETASSGRQTGSGSVGHYARPEGTPESLREYIKLYGSRQQKGQIALGAILIYLGCAVTLILALMNETPAALIDVLLPLPLAILVHVRKSKGCAIALVCVTALEMIGTSVIAGGFRAWIPLAGAIMALTAILRADKGYQALLSSGVSAPAASESSRRPQKSAPQWSAPGSAPAKSSSWQTELDPPIRNSSGRPTVLEPGRTLESNISLQCSSFTGWREGRIEISNDVIILYAKNMLVRAAFGAIGSALASGKEVMRFDPREIRRFGRTKKKQIRLELNSSAYVVVSAKQDVIDTLAAYAAAVNASAL